MITVSGVAGAGKDTIVDAAMPFLRSLGIEWAPGITTRDPRPSDKPGAMIHVSHEKFLTMVASGEVMEYATVVGQSYGTPAKAITAGPNGAIKIVTVDGVLSIHRWMKGRGLDPASHHLCFYVTVPREQAHERLRGRGWTDEMIAERDSFNLPGCEHERIVQPQTLFNWISLPNPDGGLDAAVRTLIQTVRDFLR